MLLNIIMFIIGAACGFAFATCTETEDEDNSKDEYFEKDYFYDEDEKI